VDIWPSKQEGKFCVAVKLDEGARFAEVCREFGVECERFNEDSASLRFRNAAEIPDDRFAALLDCAVQRIARRRDNSAIVFVSPADAERLAGHRILDYETFTSIVGHRMRRTWSLQSGMLPTAVLSTMLIAWPHSFPTFGMSCSYRQATALTCGLRSCR
jgi:hypothetical protein